MAFSKKNRKNTFSGIGFVAIFAFSALYLSEIQFFKELHLSPLIIGIVLGIIYANSLKNKIPVEWQTGITFSTKTILRTAIVFYGFRLTFQEIADVGLAGMIIATIMLITTFIIGVYVGTKFLGIDKETAILTASGSSVCGAAAVLATEPVVKAKPYQSAIAVSTVVLFGTLSMFLYPMLYKMGIFNMDNSTFGIYIGATLHEVANVVAAGNGVSEETAHSAVIVKMTRVMMIAPLLVIIGLWLSKTNKKKNSGKKMVFPWFAIGFIIVIAINSLITFPDTIIDTINTIDTFMLTMAMSALGMGTYLEKFKGAGSKPILLAFIMFLWLFIGGYFITNFIVSIF